MAKMMTIKTSITLVDANGSHEPGEPVTLPVDEGKSILERFGGEEIVEKAAPKGKGDPDVETAAKKAVEDATAKGGQA